MHLVITRDVYTNNETLGVVELEDLRYQTMERSADDAVHPCVPEGIYALVPHNTEKHPRTFALVNRDLGVVHEPEPGMRSAILIHPANWAKQLEGCIAPGKTRSQDETGWMVTHSREAYDALMARLPWEMGHTIEIKRTTEPTP